MVTLGALVSSTNKTDRHDIPGVTEILLKKTLKHHNPIPDVHVLKTVNAGLIYTYYDPLLLRIYNQFQQYFSGFLADQFYLFEGNNLREPVHVHVVIYIDLELI